MRTRNAEILLIAVIIARSTSFVMTKAGMDALQPMNMMAIRFGIAFIIMALLFRKRLAGITRKTMRNGVLIGLVFFAVMVAEMLGLYYTDSSKIAFLENAAIVYVPLMEAVILRRLPRKSGIACSLLAITGVGFLSLGGGMASFGLGEALGVLSGLLYGVAIIVTDRLAKDDDGLLIGIVQVGVMAAGAGIASLIWESPVLPQTPVSWGLIIALAVICTCFGWTLQPFAQKYVSTERTSMFLAFSPLSAALLGVLFLHEHLGAGGIIGGILIMTGILWQTIVSIRESHKEPAQGHRPSAAADATDCRDFFVRLCEIPLGTYGHTLRKKY